MEALLGGRALLLRALPAQPQEPSSLRISMSAERSEFPPLTRAQALERLAQFVPRAADYAHRRGFVEPGYSNVSRLSPANRVRLLGEAEICRAARREHAARTLDSFEREVWWRLYWKGWLEMRPSVWNSYRRDLDGIEWSERARRVAAGESGVAVMDSFARELVATGYLHNHARMWWASFWIHVERLPWQLGAEFFLRHLLDGDAASNTLSWRWVAGLHTRGKNYLVRRSNIERYLAAGRLAENQSGIEVLDGATTVDLPYEEPPPPVSIESALPGALDGPWGLWLHDEDLLPEDAPLAGMSPSAVAAVASTGLWRQHEYSRARRDFLRTTLVDGAERAGRHFGITSAFLEADSLPRAIAGWAREAGLRRVAATRPFVGDLADELGKVEAALAAEGIRLVLVRRPLDVELMNRATAGFFGFWKKTATIREQAIAASTRRRSG